MTAPRFVFALALILGLFAFFFWRMQPETRIDQVITSDVPSAGPLAHRPRLQRLPASFDAGASVTPFTD